MSIDIPFNNKSYLALVSIRKQENNLSCQIRYVDHSLSNILPGDLLVFNPEEGLKYPRNLADEKAEMLVKQTAEAICKRLSSD